MAAPKRITKRAWQLERALEQVRKCNAEIIDWIDSKGEDGYDLACELNLDNAYEFDLRYLLEELNRIADR